MCVWVGFYLVAMLLRITKYMAGIGKLLQLVSGFDFLGGEGGSRFYNT